METVQVNSKIESLINNIDCFYKESFMLPTGQSMMKMGALAEQLMLVLAELKPDDMQRINGYFLLTVEAMEKKDIVLIRDYLLYEIKPFLVSLLNDL